MRFYFLTYSAYQSGVGVTLVYVCVCDAMTVWNSYYVSTYFGAYGTLLDVVPT